MLTAERETFRTLVAAPWLPAAGLVVAAAWSLAHLVAAAPVVVLTLPRNTGMVFALPLANLLSVALLPPALAGLYPTARRARERDGHLGVGATARLYVGGCVRHARDLTAATVVYRLAALVPAAVALVALLAGDTTVTYARYATGGVDMVNGRTELVVAWLWVMLAGAVGRLVFAFYDLPVLFAGVAPERCWRAALRFARLRPRSLVRYGAVRLALWAPMGIVVAFEAQVLADAPEPTELAMLAAGALLCGAVTAAAIAAHHVVTYERAVEPVLGEPTPTGGPAEAGPESALVASPGDDAAGESGGTGPSRRTAAAGAVAVLLVVATAAGTVGVRVADQRPMPDAGGPVPADATGEEVVEGAYRVLETEGYRSRVRVHRTNGTTGERTLVWALDAAVDRRERTLRLDSRLRDDPDGEWLRTGFYLSETTTALRGFSDPTRRVPVRSRLVVRRAGNWTVVAVPGYETVGGEVVDTGGFDPDRHDPAVVERTDERVVVASTWRPDGDRPEDGEHLAVERVRMVVDADTGRPLEFVSNLTFHEYDDGTVVARHRSTERRTFSDHGEVEVERPTALGPRGPVEWLWDLVYY